MFGHNLQKVMLVMINILSFTNDINCAVESEDIIQFLMATTDCM